MSVVPIPTTVAYHYDEPFVDCQEDDAIVHTLNDDGTITATCSRTGQTTIGRPRNVDIR